jgi:hypothetical protein
MHGRTARRFVGEAFPDPRLHEAETPQGRFRERDNEGTSGLENYSPVRGLCP